MIPTFRRPDLLRQSIRSALAQDSDVRFEVVVVDNDSDAAGANAIDALVRSFADTRLRLYRNSHNLGMFGNWNRCIELARGAWLSILNDDDLLHSDFLRSTMAQMQRQADIHLLFTKSEFMDERGSDSRRKLSKLKQACKKVNSGLLQKKLSRLRTEDIFLDSPCSSLATLFRRQDALDLGGFKAHAFPSADYVFFSMYHLRFGSHQLNQYLGYYRIHQSETAKASTGEGFVSKNLELRSALAKHIDAPAWLMHMYAQMFALKTMREYERFWNVPLDEARIRHENGLPDMPVRPVYMLARYALRLAFSWCPRRAQHSFDGSVINHVD